MPWESCQIASGAKSAMVGTGSQSSRPAPRNCAVPNTMPSAMIQSSARAGASDGVEGREHGWGALLDGLAGYLAADTRQTA